MLPGSCSSGLDLVAEPRSADIEESKVWRQRLRPRRRRAVNKAGFDARAAANIQHLQRGFAPQQAQKVGVGHWQEGQPQVCQLAGALQSPHRSENTAFSARVGYVQHFQPGAFGNRGEACQQRRRGHPRAARETERLQPRATGKRPPASDCAITHLQRRSPKVQMHQRRGDHREGLHRGAIREHQVRQWPRGASIGGNGDALGELRKALVLRLRRLRCPDDPSSHHRHRAGDLRSR
mmetsp:Transcript_95134/g.275033  ORF Transcript_95134/g.275033 Transcript_95134/m.275033 type:complete len:236 (-) Transcript_95134:559-1266(-)